MDPPLSEFVYILFNSFNIWSVFFSLSHTPLHCFHLVVRSHQIAWRRFFTLFLQRVA